MADAAALPMSQDGKHIIAASKSTPMAETLSASFLFALDLQTQLTAGTMLPMDDVPQDVSCEWPHGLKHTIGPYQGTER